MQYVPVSQQYPPGAPKDAAGNTLLENSPLRETWQAMEALVDSGLAKVSKNIRVFQTARLKCHNPKFTEHWHFQLQLATDLRFADLRAV